MIHISTAYQVVNVIVTANNIAYEMRSALENLNLPILSRVARIGTVVLKAIPFAVNAFALGAQINGASEAVLATIKGLELTTRNITTPILTGLVTVRWCAQDISLSQAIEQGVVSPYATFLRANSEFSQYHYKDMSTLPEDQRQEPFYSLVRQWMPDRGLTIDENPIIDPYEPLTVQQCLDLAKVAEGFSIRALVIETASELGTVKKMAAFTQWIYQRVINQIYRQAPARGETPIEPAVVVEPDPVDLLDLLRYHLIPDDFHEDVVFSKYICPITHAPIRHPVRDPNGTTLYERAAIEEAIQRTHRSPITRWPLEKTQLQQVPVLKAAINQRLTFHEQNLRNALRSSLVHLPQQDVMTSVEEENPNYQVYEQLQKNK